MSDRWEDPSPGDVCEICAGPDMLGDAAWGTGFGWRRIVVETDRLYSGRSQIPVDVSTEGVWVLRVPDEFVGKLRGREAVEVNYMGPSAVSVVVLRGLRFLSDEARAELGVEREQFAFATLERIAGI